MLRPIDYETDAIVQSSLRTELKSDVTVITVAHRLQTIMDYDKIVRILVIFLCYFILILIPLLRWSSTQDS